MRLEQVLCEVPGRVQLLARCRELNHRARQSQLLACLAGNGTAIEPPRYLVAPSLRRLRQGLDQAYQALESAELVESRELTPHYRARVQELALEAQLAESVGTAAFARLAERRFPSGSLSVDTLCVGLGHNLGGGRRMPCPQRHIALSAVVQRWIDALGWPLRVALSTHLASRAAFGGDTVWVDPTRELPPRTAARVAAHELLGHALPALNAATQPVALLRLGSAGGLDCQEGRALLIEQRYQLLDAERLVELRARHLAALAWREGSGLVGAARVAAEQGCCAARASAISLRVARGGGLCRELGYLQQAHAVRSATQQEPALDTVMGLGTVGLDAARCLAACDLTTAPRFSLDDRMSRQLGLAQAVDTAQG